MRLHEEGKRIVFIVPTLMLKFNIERYAGRGKVFTFDSIRSGVKPHPMRADLILELINADAVVIDEAHSLDLHYSLKPQIINELSDELRRVAKTKPVFFLTGTPSVNQIVSLSDTNTSKIISYLRKEQKRIRVEKIDREGLQSVIGNHDRILIFIDDKRQIDILKAYIEKHINPEHTIFPISSNISTLLKKRTEEEIQEIEKWIIIGTSSVVSGINLEGLQTIVFSCRMMNQPDLYQCIGRLRIVNNLDVVHPLYIMNMSDYKNPKAELDQFEFVSPNAIISYLKKLYHVTQIVSCETKVCSFTRLSSFEDWKMLIKSVSSIREYYALPQVQEQSLYWIPMSIIRDLNRDGFYEEYPNWFNIHVKSVLYSKNDDIPDHRAVIKRRNKDMSVSNPIWHYFDPKELYAVITGLKMNDIYVRRLPRDVRDILETMN